MELLATDYTRVIKNEFCGLMNGTGIDTSKIPNVYFENLLILEEKSGFYECIFDVSFIISDYKTNTKTHGIISDRIDTIEELKKYIIMQLAYENIK